MIYLIAALIVLYIFWKIDLLLIGLIGALIFIALGTESKKPKKEEKKEEETILRPVIYKTKKPPMLYPKKMEITVYPKEYKPKPLVNRAMEGIGKAFKSIIKWLIE